MRGAKERELSYADQLDFIGLSESGFDDGLEVWAIVEPEIGSILVDFYKHLEVFSPKKMFAKMDTEKLAGLQKQHWKRLFTGFYSEEYVKAAKKIGRAHNHIGLSAEWYIGSYVFLSNRMTDVIFSHHAGRENECRAMVALLNRLTALDMGIAMSVYQED